MHAKAESRARPSGSWSLSPSFVRFRTARKAILSRSFRCSLKHNVVFFK
jgi:hypothetical protein